MTKTQILFLVISISFQSYAQQYVDVQQWIQLTKHAKLNLNHKANDAKQKRVVFIGNSITEGW